MTANTVASNDWNRIVHAGAVAIATKQLEPNDGTPEEYAAWALQAMLPQITDVLTEHLDDAFDLAEAFEFKAAMTKAIRIVRDVSRDLRPANDSTPRGVS